MRFLIPVLLLFLSGAGCDKPEYPDGETTSPAVAPEAAGTGSPSTSETGGGASSEATAATQAGSLELGTIKGNLPKDWIAQPGQREFRVGTYKLPKVAGDTGDTQFIVFYFGEGQGGSVEENLTRWKGMMKMPAGQDVDKVAKVTKIEKGGVKVTVLDLPGTYLEKPFPMAQEFTERPNYRLIAAVIENTKPGASSPYFTRLVGPAKSVQAAKVGWDAFVASLKAD